MPNPAQPLNNRVPIVNADGTPTAYFIRMMQEFSRKTPDTNDLDGKADKSVVLTAGHGLSGGGDLSANRTFDLDANIGDLNDVDLSTPPTDQQVLVFDAGTSRWVPADQSGGSGSISYWVVHDTGTGLSQNVTLPYSVDSEEDIDVFVNGVHYETDEYSVSGTTLTLTTNASGDSIEVRGELISGGGGGSTPSFVQLATLRNDGTISLPSAPTVGNLMVLMKAGYGGSIDSYSANGFTPVGKFISNNSNAVACMARVVQSGDTGSYSLSASDNQAAVLYEFSGALTVFPCFGGAMSSSFYTSTNFSLPLLPSPFSGAVGLIGLENDTTPVWSISSATGLTVDYTVSADTLNHTSAFCRTDPATFENLISGSLSGSNNNPVFGVFAVIGI